MAVRTPFQLIVVHCVLFVSASYEIKEEPTFNKEPTSNITAVGEVFQIVTDIEGYPEPTVSWYHNGRPIEDSNRFEVSREFSKRGSLTIHNVSVMDEGVYYLNIKNAYGSVTSQRAYLTVYAPAYITEPLKNIQVAYGQLANLSCSYGGKPEPRVHWKKDRHAHICPDSKVCTSSSITINVTSNATYTCVVENVVNLKKVRKMTSSYVTYIEDTRPKGYCVDADEIETKHCGKFMRNQRIFLNYSYEDPVHLSENLLSKMMRLEFEPQCKRNLENLVCNRVYRPCDDNGSLPFPIATCRESCNLVKSTCSGHDWDEFLKHVNNINIATSGRVAYLHAIDCENLPIDHCHDLEHVERQTPAPVVKISRTTDQKTEVSYEYLAFIIVGTIGGCIVLLVVVAVIILSSRKAAKNYKKKQIQAKVQSINVESLQPNTFYHHRLASTSSSVRMDDLEYPRNSIVYLGEIGKGALSRVFKAKIQVSIHGHFQEKLVAVKMLAENANKMAEEMFVRETEQVCEFDHQNIIKLIGVCFKDRPICSIYEYLEEGCLKEFLRRNNQHFIKFEHKQEKNEKAPRVLTKVELLDMATQIACGMMYLSCKGITHRDLAARNCLVGDNLIVKISDFGLLQRMDEEVLLPRNEPVPIRWMAPEAIFHNAFSTKSDVWSFGVVLWEIFSLGEDPYNDLQTNEEVIHYVKNGNILPSPNDTSEEVYKLMIQCWMVQAKERPNFAQLYNRLGTLTQQYASTRIAV